MKNTDRDMLLLHAEDTTPQQRTDAKIIVISHANCQDGWVSAVLARIALGCSEVVLFEFRKYDQKFDMDKLPLYAGKHILILDFSFPETVLHLLTQAVQSLTVLDHHKTFAESLKEDPTKPFSRVITCEGGAGFLHYEPDLCGAQMTYNYFADGKYPDFIKHTSKLIIDYVGDRDLWKWQLADSHEINEFLAAVPKTFIEWESLMDEFNGRADQYAEIGTTLLVVKKQEVERLANAYFLADIAGYKNIPVCNSQSHQSEVGHRMLELCPDAPFVGIYYDVSASVRNWSLRGRQSDDFDCSAIAKKWGGGGHAKACGFTTTPQTDPILNPKYTC